MTTADGLVRLVFSDGKHALWTDDGRQDYSRDAPRWDWTINHVDGTPIAPTSEALGYLTLEACLADCPEPLKDAYLAANPAVKLRQELVVQRRLAQQLTHHLWLHEVPITERQAMDVAAQVTDSLPEYCAMLGLASK